MSGQGAARCPRAVISESLNQLIAARFPVCQMNSELFGFPNFYRVSYGVHAWVVWNSCHDAKEKFVPEQTRSISFIPGQIDILVAAEHFDLYLNVFTTFGCHREVVAIIAFFHRQDS